MRLEHVCLQDPPEDRPDFFLDTLAKEPRRDVRLIAGACDSEPELDEFVAVVAVANAPQHRGCRRQCRLVVRAGPSHVAAFEERGQAQWLADEIVLPDTRS